MAARERERALVDDVRTAAVALCWPVGAPVPAPVVGAVVQMEPFYPASLFWEFPRLRPWPSLRRSPSRCAKVFDAVPEAAAFEPDLLCPEDCIYGFESSLISGFEEALVAVPETCSESFFASKDERFLFKRLGLAGCYSGGRFFKGCLT